MNKIYHKIQQSINDATRIISNLDLEEDADGNTITFLDGTFIDAPMPKLFEFEIKCKKDTAPRHFLEDNGILVISDLFLSALRKAGVDNYQAWPVILREKSTKRTWEKYHAFNEVGLLDAASLKDCKYDVIMDGDDLVPPVLGFHKVVFAAKKFMDKKMFRIPQSTSALYLSDEVMTTLDKLTPPEKWGITTTNIELR
jgi:hypothetical protein